MNRNNSDRVRFQDMGPHFICIWVIMGRDPVELAERAKYQPPVPAISTTKPTVKKEQIKLILSLFFPPFQ